MSSDRLDPARAAHLVRWEIVATSKSRKADLGLKGVTLTTAIIGVGSIGGALAGTSWRAASPSSWLRRTNRERKRSRKS